MKHKVFRLFFSVSGVILLSKAAGFFKHIVTASAFGATIETDLISISQGFISNLEYLLTQTMATAFIPIYIYAKARGTAHSERLVSDTLKFFAAVACGLGLVMIIFADQIARVLAPTYPAETSFRLARYIQLFSLVLILYICMAVFRALLNANEHFIPGELVGFNQSVILILVVAIFARTLGVYTLVLSFFIYNVWNLLFLGVRSKPYWTLSMGNPLHNQDVQNMLHMMGPLLLGYSMVYVNQQVDKILASGLSAGTVTAMNYGAVLSNSVGTFIGTFCTILFTYITQKISSGDDQAAALLTDWAAVILVTLILPIEIVTVLRSEDIVTVVFAHGAFGESAVEGAANALRGYGFSFVPLILRELFSRVQYGYQDSKWPMVNSTIGILLNIMLSILLCGKFGVLGITLASSISTLACGLLNIVSAKRYNRFLNVRSIFRLLPLWAIGGSACAVICQKCAAQFEACDALLRFILVACCSCGGYFLITGYAVYQLFREKAALDAGGKGK